MAKNDPASDAPKANPAPKAPDPKEAAKALRAKLCDPEQQVKAIFVDANGDEFPARILPVPINKGVIIQVPLVVNYVDEMQKIATLPREKQVQAVKELNEKAGKSTPALSINNRIIDLCEYGPDKMLCWAGHDAEGKNVPVCDLMVDYTVKTFDGAPEILKHRSRVLPAEYVGVAPKGQKGRAHFRLA